jgi:hypothetical protein
MGAALLSGVVIFVLGLSVFAALRRNFMDLI